MFQMTVVSEVFRSTFRIYFAPFQLPIRKARGFPGVASRNFVESAALKPVKDCGS